MHLKALALMILMGLTAGLQAENWPAFRGPLGNGKSSEKDHPNTGSPTEKIKPYNPDNGQLLWNCKGLTKLVYTSPLIKNNTVIAMPGLKQNLFSNS